MAKVKEVEVLFLEEFIEVLNPKWRYIIFYGGRGSGKSYNVALSLILKARQKRVRVLCTREIQNTIKDSVHKLLSDIINKLGLYDFTITKDVIKNCITGSEFIFKGLRHNTNEIKSMEGVDIAWVEEAQAVTEASWDVLTPTIRKKGSQIIITFNRLKELDPVWVKFCQNPHRKTYIKKVNYDVLESYGLLSDALILEREKDKKDPDLYAWKWLGEPARQSDNAIISRALLMQAMERKSVREGVIEVGVDVARLGGDRTVFAMRQGSDLIKLKAYNKKRITETCDLLENFVEFDKMVLIKIDDTGVGGGVTDEMLKRGYRIAGVNFGSKAKDPNKYPNLISEAWFELAEKLEGAVFEVKAPELVDELSTRFWQMDTKGRRAVESKEAYKKRGYRSPDLADAVILAFYSPKEKKVLEYAGTRFL